MKVDKAVCTKDTQKDLTTKTTIQYETMFTTLIENKISAIKRECEGKKKTKRQKHYGKPFGKIFFGRRIFGESRSNREDDIEETTKQGYPNEVVIDIEKDDTKTTTTTSTKNAAKIIDNQRRTIDIKGDDITKITTLPNVNTVEYYLQQHQYQYQQHQLQQERKPKSEIESDDETSITVQKISRIKNSLKDDSNGSNGNGSLDEKGTRDMIVEVITHREGHAYDDSNGGGCGSGIGGIAGAGIGENGDGGGSASVIDNKNGIGLHESDERNVESSSLGSVRIDESTNADDSLTSIKDSVESLSFPSSYCTISAGIATVSNERECLRLRVLEAKSISAQCSPILPRQSKPSPLCSAQTQTQTYHYPKLHKSQVSYSDNHRDNYDTLRFFSRQNTSEDSVNLTVSTLLHEADSINALGERKSKSTSLLVISDKENKNAINRLDSNSIVSNQSNPLARGFISSLNQLTTTTSNYFPVITTTITALKSKTSLTKTTTTKTTTTTIPSDPLRTRKLSTTIIPSASVTSSSSFYAAAGGGGGVVAPTATSYVTATASTAPTTTTISSCDTAKLQRMTSTSTGSSVAPTGCCNTKAFSKDKDKWQKPLWQTGQSGSDDEYRKRKRKYKRYHRCSDPVLVYPSSGELQHCILSMPPNQPIQFYYNDDFLYDMTLQVEADQNGDLQAIVPSHRSKRHNHHRHKKRNRHQKPKILVHDLDTQSVKVIDPDDLPQRARWTIIATACLLLLMCLMLVGITLRMAPIIDDMDNPGTKRKPPKLKAIDRSISIAIDNYIPSAPPRMIIDDSLILEEQSSPPPSHITTKPDIYFVGGTSTSPISSSYDDCPHHLRKSNFRRSDTLDVHSPSNFQMRKTHSFHSNDPTIEEFMLSTKRTNSVRGSYLFPQPTEAERTQRSPSPSRRGCRMHRSFNEPTKRPKKNDIAIEGIKYPSLNDEILHQPDPSLQEFNPAKTAFGSEILRSRSNSHTKSDDDHIFEDEEISDGAAAIAAIGITAVPGTSAGAVGIGVGGGGPGSTSTGGVRKSHSHKHSSHSLDQQQQYNFKRGSRHTHSLYLSPNSFEELKVHRSLQAAAAAAMAANQFKKHHSASMRIKPYRETLSATKKSKSFIVDTYPEFELSPHRRESRIISTGDDIKRSPRPSSSGLHGHGHSGDDVVRSSFERKTSISYDMKDVDFEPVLRPFRQGIRKTSITGSMQKMKRKSISEVTDDDDESDRKRKRIVCIIMTVFLCLVCASVFVVVVTLTHSSVAQVQNQTRKIYTFSRDSPIHYNVRQENERLMQESMNRARFAKNFTDAAAAAAAAAASLSSAAATINPGEMVP